MMLSEQTIQTSVGEVKLYHIRNNHQFEVVLCSYGASIYEIKYIRPDGTADLLTLTPENFEDFLSSKAYYGKTIGRTSGRLFGPEVTINNTSYHITPFTHQNAQLHGGAKGFSFKHFQVKETIHDRQEVTIKFSATSHHLESDLPGNLDVEVTYKITDDDQIFITYDATTDQDTICNLTNHTYFSLQQHHQSMQHQHLFLASSQYLDIQDDYHIKGIAETKDTLFDFQIAKPISHTIHHFNPTPFKGIDHPFLLNHQDAHVIDLYDTLSFYGLKVYTTYPCVVIYTHNYPPGERLKIYGDYAKHQGLTFECQFEPDGIHHPYLNAAVLRKDESYHHQIIYAFYKKEEVSS